MIQSSLRVVTPATSSLLTTLEHYREEIATSAADTDSRILRWIAEESGRIEDYLGRPLMQEGLEETFYFATGSSFGTFSSWNAPFVGQYSNQTNPPLVLSRRPVTGTPVCVLDDVTLDDDEFLVDAGAGLLTKMTGGDDSLPSWWFGTRLVVTYTAGYETIDDLPRPIEAACLGLLRHRSAATGRDPLLRRLEVPGVAMEEYWIGGRGDDGDLPPEITSALARYRSINV